MKKSLLSIVLLLASLSTAFADAPSVQYRAQWSGQIGSWRSTQQSACTDLAALATTLQGAYGTFVSPNNCTIRRPDASVIYSNQPLYQATLCFDGSAPDTSKALNLQCATPPPTCTFGRVYDTVIAQGTKSANGTTTDMKFPKNIGGCQVVVQELLGCDSNAAGQVFCRYRVKEGNAMPTGESNTPTTSFPTDPTSSTPTPPFNPAQGQGCPKGTVSLGIDSTGQSICGGSGTTPTTPPKTEVKQPPSTVTNGDGSTTKTEVTTRTNTDGSTTTTTKTTTTGTDGKVTTSESSSTGAKPTTAGGGSGKDDSSDDKKDLCSKNPDLNICKNSTVTGTCEALACTGDAIACTVAKQAAEMNCRQKKNEDEIKASPQYTLGQQAAGGSDPLAGQLPTKGNAVSFAMPTSIESQGWLGGGSCFQDKSFALMGQTLVVPISKVCDYLIVLRFVSMIIASLVSFKMLSGVILKD